MAERRPHGRSSLVDAVLEMLARDGLIAREGSTVRLARHAVTLEGREGEVQRLVDVGKVADLNQQTVSSAKFLLRP